MIMGIIAGANTTAFVPPPPDPEGLYVMEFSATGYTPPSPDGSDFYVMKFDATPYTPPSPK